MPMPTNTPGGAARFDALCEALLGTGDFIRGQMFGCAGLKRSSGKFFVTQWEDDLAFKLDPVTHAEASALSGSQPLAPDPRRPMKAWVRVAPEHAEHDERFARAAAAALG